MKAAITIFLIFLIATSYQNNRQKDEDQIVTFNLKKLPKVSTVKLSDLGFIGVKYIPLETNEQSLISGINYVFFDDYGTNKIISEDGYFLIKNRDKILKFLEDGSFITGIGKIGRGPGEINRVEDLGIDKENQNVYMVSGWQKKFNLYSADGEFMKTFNVPFYIREFRFIEDKILCYCGNNTGNNKNSFVLIDKQGNNIKSFTNRYKFQQKSGYGFTHENLFYGFNNHLFIKELYSDTIYVFDDLDFKPYTVIGVGKRLVTPKVRSESSMLNICANYIQPLNLFEFGDYIYYAFIYKYLIPDDVLIYGFIGSQKDDLQVLFNLGQGIINDLDGGPGIIPLTIKDDNTIIAMVDALTLKNHIKSEEFTNSIPKYPEKKKELEKLAVRLKETDNPVLVLVSLKE